MKQKKGFVKVHRGITEWEWYKDTNTKSLFLHCLFMANYEEKWWQGRVIKIGQFPTSINSLAYETGLSIQNVRTSLNKLELTGELTREITRGKNSFYTIITVNNWKEYQLSNTSPNKSPNTEITSELTTPKEYKENKEYKEDNILSISKMVVDYLNKKTGKAYRYSDTTLKHIKARLNEGFTLDDCKKVIDTKCAQWLHNDMNKFLRTETLFGSKFETYLNEQQIAPSYMVNDEVVEDKATLNEIEETRKMLNDITKKV